MSDKSLTKTQFYDEFASKVNSEFETKYKRKDAAVIVDKLLEVATEHCTDAHGCTIPNFCKVCVAQSKARMGRNPATGESIKIPSKIKGKLRLCKVMKETLSEIGEKVFGGKKKKSKSKEEKPNKKEKKLHKHGKDKLHKSEKVSKKEKHSKDKHSSKKKNK